MTDDPASPGALDPGPGREPVEVDALGMPCPRPVIELANAVRALPVGATVRLVADDPAASVDVPVWCRMQRQRLLSRDEDGRVLTFLVEKTRELS